MTMMFARTRSLGRRIREARNEMGWSQTELGQEMTPAVSGATISRWETGHHVPTVEHLKSLIDVFEWDSEGPLVRQLLYGRDQEHTQIRVQLAAAELAAEQGQPLSIGTHKVLLLSDGTLLVNGKIEIQPE